MADFIGYKHDLIFTHVLDDIVVKILKLDDDTFVWLQYGPTELGLDVNVMMQYDLEQVRKMVEHLEPYTKNISALDLFEKFILNT